jgi:multidrug transporter EmrE-like cation transporter
MIMLFLIQSILGLNTSIAYWALAGIACIITFILSFGYRKKTKTNFTFLICVLMGFQAWLGKRLLTLY